MKYLLILVLCCACSTGKRAVDTASSAVPAPLFADPHYHGSCDPEVVWNAHAKEWWVFYTARRAKRSQGTYVGTPIGVAASKDFRSWRFVGYCAFDGLAGKPDMPVTFWAPGILRHGDTYHMFVTFKDNANPPWGGSGQIVHYKADASNLLFGWKKADVPSFTGPDPIDATLIAIDGRFHAYYRVGRGGGIQCATSDDLEHWINQGPCPGDLNDRAKHGHRYQEAPYVFRWQGSYWMLTDPHQGLAIFRSDDSVHWEFNGHILQSPGTRPYDNTRARHPSVAVAGDRAFIFYHVEPNRPYPSPPAEKRTVQQKLSFLQMAELQLDDGRLTCDRDMAIVLP